MANRIRPILLAIRAQVEAQGFTLAGYALPVLIRKAPVRRQTMDPARAITVSKSRTPEQVTRRRFALHQTAYAVEVTLVSPYTGPEGDTSEQETIRDSIVDLFKGPPLAGAPEVFDLDAQPADWLTPLGETTEWDWQTVQVIATVAHA